MGNFRTSRRESVKKKYGQNKKLSWALSFVFKSVFFTVLCDLIDREMKIMKALVNADDLTSLFLMSPFYNLQLGFNSRPLFAPSPLFMHAKYLGHASEHSVYCVPIALVT